MSINDQETATGDNTLRSNNAYFRAQGPAQDRFLHFAMDELALARDRLNHLTLTVGSRDKENELLSHELNRTRSILNDTQFRYKEMDALVQERDTEITALKISMAVLKSELEAINADPTKARIRQLLKRIGQMAPQRQFVVQKKSGRKFGVLGASSVNGVTTITVTNQPTSR